MVIQYAEPTHPIVAAAAGMRSSLAGVADLDPMFMTPTAQGAALTELTAVISQAVELRARVLTAAQAAGGVSDNAGAHDAGAWLATTTRIGHAAARAEQRLARGLDARSLVAAAMRHGEVAPEQAKVILHALDELPDDLDPQIARAAEAQLVEEAGRFDPKQLRVLGRRILEVVAPEIAEAAEAKALEDEERNARAKTRLWLRHNGDGTTRFGGVLPDLTATRGANMLHAFTSPRRADVPAWAPNDPGSGAPDEDVWWKLPHHRKLGHAFCELLERINTSALPQHGGSSVDLVVKVDLDALRRELAVATVLGPDGEQRISASEARRLACNAGIIPVVMGGNDVPLNLGRSARLASKAQRIALALKHATCQAEHCDRPAAWCDLHHLHPWSKGGRTDLADLALLCGKDHHLIHDTSYLHAVLPDGTIRFTRRT